ncbi:hypothetical protein YC2023_115743 [Brassica napus]
MIKVTVRTGKKNFLRNTLSPVPKISGSALVRVVVRITIHLIKDTYVIDNCEQHVASVKPQSKEVEVRSELGITQSPSASQNTLRRARSRSRSRARARRRSLSQLPSHRFHSVGCEGKELVESEVLEGSNKKILGDKKMENSGKKVEVESDLSGERRNPTFLDTKVEEHIWLLSKVVRRAQKQKEQRAA